MKKLISALFAIIMCVTTSLPVFAEENENEQPTVNIPVEVTLKGTLPSTSETYSIVLKPDDASYPMPEGTEDGEYVLEITGADKSSFTIAYDTVGIYTYKIYQNKGSNTKCTYDETVYTLTVYITNAEDGSNKLKVSVALKPGQKAKEDAAVFENVYETEKPKPSTKPGSPATPTPSATFNTTKTNALIPNTGDTGVMWMYAGIVGVAVVALGILFFVRKRYSEK